MAEVNSSNKSLNGKRWWLPPLWLAFPLIALAVRAPQPFEKVNLGADQRGSYEVNRSQFPLNNFVSHFMGDGIEHYQTKGFVVFDPNFGTQPRSNFERRHIMKKGDQVFFDVFSRTDSVGRRVTERNPKDFERTIVLFGDSFVFGEGLNQGETLADFIAAEDSRYRAFNYGFGGHGPANILARIQGIKPDNFSGGNQKDGSPIFVYLLNDFQLDRWKAGIQTYRYTWHDPKFEISGDGQVTRNGFRDTADPIRDFLTGWLANSWLIRRTHWDWPSVSSKNVEWEVTRVVAQMNAELKVRFPGSVFYTLIYPGSKKLDDLISELRKTSIPVMEFSKLDLARLCECVPSIPHDGHPTGLANKALAKAILDQLHVSN